MSSTVRLLSALALSLLCATASALSTDRDQPINIEADWAEADDARRITIYKGKVIVIQGTIRITGDIVTMYYDAGRSLSKLVATGRPARFRQTADGVTPGTEGELQHAIGTRIEYLVGSDTMILVGAAHLSQGTSKVSADRIVYDTERSIIKAESKPEPAKKDKPARGRVRIVIEPTPKN